MSELNPRQRDAAYCAGSVAVTAGAGTGKTHVLAERYQHLLTANGWSPLQVVAVTFTDKAAAELRSRIRASVRSQGGSPKAVAEVDAAQISTIHALAARICRDFYDVAGIPCDFVLMDDNESKLWSIDKLEEAVGAVCGAEVRELGYTFLIDALGELLADPYKAGKALARCTRENWSAAVDAERKLNVEAFTAFLSGADCVETLRRSSGAMGDKMESNRCTAIAAIDAILAGDFSDSNSILSINLQGGSAKNWPNGDLPDVKDALKKLRAEAAKLLPGCQVCFGPSDEELLAKVEHLAAAFEKSRAFVAAEKLKEKFLDYNDLELYALKVLQNADARAHYRERWEAFLVDEFQDTNPVQAELLELLTDGANLTVVGDEKQSIYGFRGADAEVFGRFRKRIEADGGAAVELEETYRANEALVTKMNEVFAPLLGKMHQPLRSEREAAGGSCPDPITLAVVESDEGSKPLKVNVEARRIAREVRRMVDERVHVYDKALKTNRPVEYKDFAVLSRVWDPLETYGDALAEAGVPAVNAGGGSLTDTREFKDAYALVTFLADQLDDLSLVAVLRSPFFAVSDRVLYNFALTIPRDASWWAVLQSAESLDASLTAARDVIVNLLKGRAHYSPEGLLHVAARETGYAAVIANLPHGARREADWNGTLRFIRGLQEKGWEDLFSVARYLRLAVLSELELERPRVEGGNAVKLMTVHAAKGLEWPVVIVPDLTRKFPPSGKRVMLDSEIGVAFCLEDEAGEKVEPAIYQVIKNRCESRENEERRRLLYVAITRAGDHVLLSATGDSGAALDLLRDGLQAANIAAQPVTHEPHDTLPPAPGEPEPFADLPSDISPVHIAAESVMATGISAYAACPRRYKYQFVDGHPGLGEGAASAASIGTLAHLALELDLRTAEELKLNGGVADMDVVEKALEQANNFREREAFARFRDAPIEKELRFSSVIGDIRVYGIADAVGEDFVLDYKTDAVPDPEKHSLQLWAYARALGKQKAYIAYLRHDRLDEIDAARLAELDATGYGLIERLRAGDFAATASEAVCLRCTYKAICDSAFDPADRASLI